VRRDLWLIVGFALVATACGGAPATPTPGISREVQPSTSTVAASTTVAVESPTTQPSAPASEPSAADPASDAPPEREVTLGVGQRARVSTRLSKEGLPVFAGDFADPFLIRTENSYYAYATNTLLSHVPLMRATDGEPVVYLPDVLPELPAWSEPNHVWAPSVSPVGNGYVLWYTTRDSASGRQCISAASSSNPEGPFIDDSSEPLICDLAHGGSIDPSPLFDFDGSLRLLWKSDGNCCGQPTVIYSQRLSADGLSVTGEPVELVRNDLWWERDVVEAPTMAYIGGAYHLLYSANRWDTDDYALGHAVCESVTGPCVKDPIPWFGSYAVAWGPGGAEFVPSPNGWTGLLVYHAWTSSGIGYPEGARSLFVAKLRIVAGTPVAPSFGG